MTFTLVVNKGHIAVEGPEVAAPRPTGDRTVTCAFNDPLLPAPARAVGTFKSKQAEELDTGCSSSNGRYVPLLTTCSRRVAGLVIDLCSSRSAAMDSHTDGNKTITTKSQKRR